MTSRREFLLSAGAGVAGMAALGTSSLSLGQDPPPPARRPLVVSTWNFGIQANAEAWKTLAAGGRAVDAVEQGVMVIEGDPEISSVGYGGLPDRDGHVTLDACIMDETGNAGSVCFLEGFKHPVAVARRVMDRTPHVMLAGEGARQFALEQGFPEEDLLTDSARARWQEWLREENYQPWSPLHDPSGQDPRRGKPNPDHDTIGMLALDRAGHLAGSCTTSGLAFKMHGRVGDSPVIGASLFVDNAVGAACATGVGEEVLKTLGSFLVVELMRQGATPQQACEEAVARIVARNPEVTADSTFQVGYLALDRFGRVGAFAVTPWFQYAIHDGKENRLVDGPFFFQG
jgi:N4-(beta-N-acetylglucosaminyl)-L-asparaginase|nr:N(4)-(beta-N-acetylglucosaminyl)-L-asparaginase [Candidatus Krumholzibacteria bacterium]